MARKFSTHLLHVTGNGTTQLSEPLSWQGRISEQQLEDFIVERPQLAGEKLLVLGRQLREFQEDLDRLDVLAVDEDGEIVLLELKVDDDFRVTDLQAIAYAAAYANQDGRHFAETLRKWLSKQTGTAVSLDEAKTKIVDFLGIDDFEAWEPSQHVRIKLIAPAFPRRVLATVKWLGDLYGMRLEAIQVRLFENAPGTYELAFERVLPLPGAEEFDLTVRQRERRKRDENTARRPDVVKFLIEHDLLKLGQPLWLDRNVLPPASRNLYDPKRVIFKVTLDFPEGIPKFRWQPSDDTESQLLSPSTVPYHILSELLPDQEFRLYRSVHDKFVIEPGGETLGEIAEKHGWTESSTNGSEPVAASPLGDDVADI